MKTLQYLVVLLLVLGALVLPRSSALAGSDWDFTEDFESMYGTIYSSDAPWSSYSDYSSSTGAWVDYFCYANDGSYVARVGYPSYNWSSTYNYYLQYEFDDELPGDAKLEFWYYLGYSSLFVQHSEDGDDWTTINVQATMTSTSGTSTTVTIPAGAMYFRFKANSYDARCDAAKIDSIKFSVPLVWVNEITGFDPDNPNCDTLNLTADAGCLSTFSLTNVQWQYLFPGASVYTDLPTDYTGADGWTTTIDTVALGINSPMFTVRAQANSSAGYSSGWFEVSISVQNVIVNDFWTDIYPVSGDTTIYADLQPPLMTCQWPPNPWTYNGGAGTYYSTTEMVNTSNPIPFGGTAKKLKTNWQAIGSSTSYWQKFKLWRYDSGSGNYSQYTPIASTSTMTFQTGPVSYVLSGSQWANLPSGLCLGGTFYYGYFNNYNKVPYSGNGGPQKYLYYSSETTSARSYWYGPSTTFEMPYNVEFEASGEAVLGAKLRYRIGFDGDPVDMGEMTLSNGIWQFTWPSWAVDSSDVYIEASFDNGSWCAWRTYGPFEVTNRVNLTFQTKLGTIEPGPGSFVVDGKAMQSPATVEYLYYRDTTVSAPQYIFDANSKRWRWNSWSDGGDRTHVVSTEPYMPTTFTANYLRQYSYSVDSAVPAFSGTAQGWYDSGKDVELIIERSYVVTEGEERYDFRSYSIPALSLNGTGTTVNFVLNTDVIVFLTWQRQFYFTAINSLNSGMGNLPGWYNEGATINYTVAENMPNGDNARLRCAGYTIDGEFTPNVNSISFEIYKFTEVYWSWSQQFFARFVTNVGEIFPENNWFDEGAEVFTNSIPPESNNSIRYTFTKWQGVGAGSVSRAGGEPEADITVNSPIVQTAVWLVEYYLTVTSASGSFSPNPSEWYTPGTEVQIVATPPAVGPNSRYLPAWFSNDPDGFNADPMADTPVVVTITMNAPVTQTVTWWLQHKLTIAATEELGIQFPVVGEYWHFDGDRVYGFCKFNNGDKVVSGFTGTGAIQSSSNSYFNGSITAPTTITWEFRDRHALPGFGLEAPAPMDVAGPIEFCVDSLGRQCVAYLNGQNQIIFGVFEGGSWNNQVVDTVDTPFSFISLCMDGDQPVIARDDRESYNIVVYGGFAAPSRAASLPSVELVYQGDSAINPNAAVNPYTGEVFVSAFAANGELLMFTINGGVAVEVVDGIGIPGFYNDICVCPVTGDPIIVYQNAFDRTLRVARRTGATWNYELIDEMGNVGVDVRVKAGLSGDVFVAYRDATYNDRSFVKMAIRDPNGWTVMVIDNSGNVGRGLSMSLAGDEYPHLSYYGPNFVRLVRHLGQGWQIFTLIGNITPTGNTSVSVDENDRPVVSYGDDGEYKIITGTDGNIGPDAYVDMNGAVTPGTGGGGTGQWSGVTTGGGGGCFIATAAFGTIASADVTALTNWRDSSLAASSCGATLRGLYYAISPAVADRTSQTISALIRRLLD